MAGGLVGGGIKATVLYFFEVATGFLMRVNVMTGGRWYQTKTCSDDGRAHCYCVVGVGLVLGYLVLLFISSEYFIYPFLACFVLPCFYGESSESVCAWVKHACGKDGVFICLLLLSTIIIFYFFHKRGISTG